MLLHAWVAEDVDELFGLLSELFGESDASDSDSVNGDGEEMRDLWMSNYAGELYTILAGMELVLRVTGPGPSSCEAPSPRRRQLRMQQRQRMVRPRAEAHPACRTRGRAQRT